MPYVYSTLSNDNEYRGYKPGGADMQTVERHVLIKGGAGIANKNIITPRGVATEVTAEELEFLKGHESFKMHVENGFITFDNKKADAEEVAKDMKKKDQSAPVTPEDYTEEKAPVVNKK